MSDPKLMASPTELIALGREVLALAASSADLRPRSSSYSPNPDIKNLPIAIAKTTARSIASSYGLHREFERAIGNGALVLVPTSRPTGRGGFVQICDSARFLAWCQKISALKAVALRVRLDRAEYDQRLMREPAKAIT